MSVRVVSVIGQAVRKGALTYVVLHARLHMSIVKNIRKNPWL